MLIGGCQPGLLNREAANSVVSSISSPVHLLSSHSEVYDASCLAIPINHNSKPKVTERLSGINRHLQVSSMRYIWTSTRRGPDGVVPVHQVPILVCHQFGTVQLSLQMT